MGNVSHSRDSIDFIQMLHYKSIDLERIIDERVLPRSAFEDERKVEIIIAYSRHESKAQVDGVVRTILDRQYIARCLRKGCKGR